MSVGGLQASLAGGRIPHVKSHSQEGRLCQNETCRYHLALGLKDGGSVGQTYRSKFEQLGPERRARITFGVDRMHRQYVESNGGVSTMPYDAAEYLRDQPTIEAYLKIVQREGGPDEYVEALAVAERARRRLAGVERNAAVPSESKTQHSSMPGPEAGARNWFRRLLSGRRSVDQPHPSGHAQATASGEPELKPAAGAEERSIPAAEVHDGGISSP